MHITINDYHKIVGLIEMATLRNKMPDELGNLLDGLKKAKMVSQVNISRNVVTMNSRVLLKEIETEREIEITVTYPHNANPKERKVSVFSPIGAALLGTQEGDVASWKIPTGTGQFKVEKVLYQPEAEGHYHL
ncbi:MAG TPA: GreA/GreB family elongation factor [Ohtaekwangia sp.]|nr:GreA/GreB family elongation factor [Ohtaekwangia sp.]